MFKTMFGEGFGGEGGSFASQSGDGRRTFTMHFSSSGGQPGGFAGGFGGGGDGGSVFGNAFRNAQQRQQQRGGGGGGRQGARIRHLRACVDPEVNEFSKPLYST